MLLFPSQKKASSHVSQQNLREHSTASSIIGRATVAALLLNRDLVIPIRVADREIGRHPPIDDPIQTSN
jgi:hypothetical protein